LKQNNAYRINCNTDDNYMQQITSQSGVNTIVKKVWPSKRYGHTAVLRGDEYIIFGGYDSNGFTQNDMYAFDCLTNTWRQISYTKIGANEQDKLIFNKGFLQHCMCMDTQQEYIYVHGGLNENKLVNSDIWQFKWSTKEWKRLVPSQPVPSDCHIARLWAECYYLPSNKFVLIGGQNNNNSVPENVNYADILVFDLDTLEWKFAESYSQLVEFSRTVVTNNGKHLYIIGGQRPEHQLTKEEAKKLSQVVETQLSEDIIMNTLSFLSHNDVNNMCAVSKTWKVSKVASRTLLICTTLSLAHSFCYISIDR